MNTFDEECSGNFMMQVVDYEESFDPRLETFLKRTQMSNLGFDYHVVAIMGPQSSGKSTLMNMLFGTRFLTMDADSGRYQVTQGVWLGRDMETNTIVLDLEGTDSRERGEDAATFERKSSLFALALAEVLIVNLWTQDVGRFNAANLSLLKTVLEQDLQLFSGASQNSKDTKTSKSRMHKTRLLFVLRDYYATSYGGTSLERLEAVLRSDVNNIWNSITKPEIARGTNVEDFFDLDFFALPHKVLTPEDFGSAGLELKKRFQNGELYRTEYCRGVASDGFAAYAESVWDTIRANKELDIPSQKEMLAHVRCEQIAREAADRAEEALEPVRMSLLPPGDVAPTAIENLYSILLEIVNSAVDEYQEAAGRYSPSVADMKAVDLHTRLAGSCKSLFDSQIASVADKAVDDFQISVADVSRSVEPWSDWGNRSVQAHNSAMSLYDKYCQADELPASCLPPAKNPHPLSFARSSYLVNRKRLESLIAQETQQNAASLRSKAKEQCLRTFTQSFKPPLTSVLESAGDDVWDRTTEVSNVAWEKASAVGRKMYGPSGFGLSEEGVEEAVEGELKPECYASAMKTIKEAIGGRNTFAMRITKKFSDAFRFDSRGVPRIFTPDEDIEALFVLAKQEAENLIGRLSAIKLGGSLPKLAPSARAVSKEDTDTVVFEEDMQVQLRNELRRQAEPIFMEAKRSQEAAKIQTKIPIWLFALLLLLGWNEILMVLRSPWLLLLTVLVVPAIYVGYFMNGAAMLVPAVRAMAAPYAREAVNFINQYVPEDESNMSTTAVAESASSESSADSLTARNWTAQDPESVASAPAT